MLRTDGANTVQRVAALEILGLLFLADGRTHCRSCTSSDSARIRRRRGASARACGSHRTRRRALRPFPIHRRGRIGLSALPVSSSRYSYRPTGSTLRLGPTGIGSVRAASQSGASRCPSAHRCGPFPARQTLPGAVCPASRPWRSRARSRRPRWQRSLHAFLPRSAATGILRARGRSSARRPPGLAPRPRDR
jgi:hypothetical protein